MFEIAKTGNTYGSVNTLISFNSTNGASPQGSLLADAAGNLYGTTTNGGASGYGTVFEITGSGFVTAQATTVPEPPALALLATALLAAGLARRTAAAGTARIVNGSRRRALAIATLLATFVTTAAHASSLITIANFNNTNGANPFAGPIMDAAGNMFGTTEVGGTSGNGTVFEIAKTGNTYGLPTTLANFNGTGGANPVAGLFADTAGNLFGTTVFGGTSGNGTVFEIAKTGGSYGAPTTLASFSNTNGASPAAGLIADTAGNLFGTTNNGGTAGVGTVFEIAKSGNTYGAPTTLANFSISNGAIPVSALVADALGNLFGTTEYGGTSDEGTVFEIAKTGSSYGSPITLASFDSTNGALPIDAGGLVADAAGNLFGTTVNGGISGGGTVFEIAKTGNSYGPLTTLASLNGANPHSGLITDAAGNLFGTTSSGGSSGDGTVFEIPKTGTTYGSPTTLATFNYTNGSNPYGGLLADSAGNLFGTTSGGGTSNYGTVFEITGSGFVTAQGTTVPEPPALALLATTLIAAGLARRNRLGRRVGATHRLRKNTTRDNDGAGRSVACAVNARATPGPKPAR